MIRLFLLQWVEYYICVLLSHKFVTDEDKQSMETILKTLGGPEMMYLNVIIPGK